MRAVRHCGARSCGRLLSVRSRVRLWLSPGRAVMRAAAWFWRRSVPGRGPGLGAPEGSAHDPAWLCDAGSCRAGSQPGADSADPGGPWLARRRCQGGLGRQARGGAADRWARGAGCWLCPGGAPLVRALTLSSRERGTVPRPGHRYGSGRPGRAGGGCAALTDARQGRRQLLAGVA
jgi:hypothetical protein